MASLGPDALWRSIQILSYHADRSQIYAFYPASGVINAPNSGVGLGCFRPTLLYLHSDTCQPTSFWDPETANRRTLGVYSLAGKDLR